MEQKRGFLHDMMDLKVLVLYTLAQLPEPAENLPALAELCLLDEAASYFDLIEAVDSLLRTGHVTEAPEGTIALTDQGRSHEALTRDSLAAPLRQMVNEAVDALLRRQQREQLVQTSIRDQADGTCLVTLHLTSPVGTLMHLELPAQTRTQARELQSALFQRADGLYAGVLRCLLAPEGQDQEKAVDKQGFMG